MTERPKPRSERKLQNRDRLVLQSERKLQNRVALIDEHRLLPIAGLERLGRLGRREDENVLEAAEREGSCAATTRAGKISSKRANNPIIGKDSRDCGDRAWRQPRKARTTRLKSALPNLLNLNANAMTSFLTSRLRVSSS